MNLYISDMDGTLIADHKSQHITPYCYDLLSKLAEHNIPVTVATGRDLEATLFGLDNFVPILPIVCHNGAVVYNIHTQQTLHMQALKKQQVKTIVDLAQLHGVGFTIGLWKDNRSFACHWGENQAAIQAVLEYKKKAGYCPSLPYTQEFLDHYSSLDIALYTQDIYQLRDLESAILASPWGSSYDIQIDPMAHFIWLQALNSSKGDGIRALLEHIHLCPKEVYVFGDEMNDISMFKEDFIGITVENAIDPLKALAKTSIGPNTHDSVINFIYQHSLNLPKEGLR